MWVWSPLSLYQANFNRLHVLSHIIAAVYISSLSLNWIPNFLWTARSGSIFLLVKFCCMLAIESLPPNWGFWQFMGFYPSTSLSFRKLVFFPLAMRYIWLFDGINHSSNFIFPIPFAFFAPFRSYLTKFNFHGVHSYCEFMMAREVHNILIKPTNLPLKRLIPFLKRKDLVFH